MLESETSDGSAGMRSLRKFSKKSLCGLLKGPFGEWDRGSVSKAGSALESGDEKSSDMMLAGEGRGVGYASGGGTILGTS